MLGNIYCKNQIDSVKAVTLFFIQYIVYLYIV